MAENERWKVLVFVLFCVFSFCKCQTDPETTPAGAATTLAPTDPDPGQENANVQPNTDLAICTCDLLAGGCDVNCCCDPDCTTNDLFAFSNCDDITTPPNIQTCVQSSIIFRTNVPFTINETVPGLFCIERDNYESRNFFQVPDLVTTQEQFDQNREQYGSFSFAPPLIDTPIRETPYRSGEPVYTVYESGAIGYLSQPAPLSSTQCADTNPAAFLFSLSKSCTRSVASVAQACETNPFLNAQTYYQGFRIISTPEAFVGINATEEEQTTPAGSITTPGLTNDTITEIPLPIEEEITLWNSTFAIEIIPTDSFVCIGVDGLNRTCDFTEVPQPTYELDSTTGSYYCLNTLAQTTYYIEANGTEGILRATVGFVFRDLVDGSTPINQVFKTEFSQLGDDLTFVRSGNPGYLVGEPVLAGQLVTETQLDASVLSAIRLSGDRDNWMTIVTSGVNGQCISEPTNRVPVTFGENLRSGCFVSVTYKNLTDLCNVINNAAWNALRGPNPATYVGTFGNSNVETVGDWIQIIDQEGPAQSNPANNALGVCENVLVGMTIEIIYSNVGALGNPQPQIIGAAYTYQYQPQVRFQCMGAYCQPGNDNLLQKIQVVSAVNYVDASDPAQGVSAERPRVTASLPEDFFYPFT